VKRREFLLGTAALGCVRANPQPGPARSLDPRPPPQPELGPAPAPEIADAPAIPFGMYSAPPARMRELADAGFTWAGPFYPRELELAPDRIAAAGAAELGALVPIGFHRQPGDPIPWDPATAEREIASAVQAHADDDAIAGWYLVPEELDPDVRTDLAYLEIAARTIRAADPRGRPIFGYQPNVRGSDRLRPIARHVDRLAKGTYVNWTGHRQERAWVRWSAEQVVAATGPQQLPLVALEMFEDPSDASADDIERWVRHDVLLALLGGARGILVFSGWRRPKFDRYDDYFAAYVRVVSELRRRDVAAAVIEGRDSTLQIEAGPARVEVGIGGDVVRYPSVTTRTAGAITIVVNSASAPVVVRLPEARGELEAGHATWYPRAALLDLPPTGAAILRA
jgi:hypothetical protein